MSSTTLETVEAPNIVKKSPPPLSHRICPCQFVRERQQTRCGLWANRGPGRSVMETPARDMCVVCHELAASGVPCPHCGKPANG